MGEQNELIISKEKFNNIEKELKELIEIERPKIAKEIKEARAQGDLSENAEFDAARERQGEIESKISEYEDIILNVENGNIKTIDKSKTKNVVKIGSLVSVKKGKTVDKYTIVGSFEANPFENKISNNSPLAIALIGSSIGDTVKVNSKKSYSVTIEDIK
ncbi:MAG: transcription elongation factor GreA [Mycoplasma sp.]|nr:transcription elongation factor GreA [Mycoplasma sp.]